MAKKAKGSHSTSSASASSASGKLVLRIKSNEGIKRSVRQTNSRKKPKAKLKKNRRKFDAMKPKKPPTAFFYFFSSYLLVFGDDRVRGTREQMILQVELMRLRCGVRSFT
ncbi:hypothetical protein DEO72_LG6g1944 [Vigna unguiculata]|uniref:Uncharacterized protein n=1 Tax=Vigna unguiculata TaxID=3917 RepID=A0A4D6MBU4_VIGUN|nr:hypothetical protein DEO72_LG6g1944 [Vigna unguiculata]